MAFYDHQVKGSNLFSFPLLGSLIKNRGFLFILRSFNLFLILAAIWYGFAYPELENNPVTTGLMWNLFWPFFIILSLTTFGAAFCGICPHGFIGEYLTRWGLNRKPPRWLKNPWIGLVIVVLFYWTISYTFSGSFNSPFNSALLFLALTLLAIVTFALFKDMAYCKFICPIGAIIRAFSKVSFTWLSSNKEDCKSCKTFDCAKACSYKLSPFRFDEEKSMSDCTLCFDCAQSCDSIEYKVVKPSLSLLGPIKKMRNIDIWVYIIMLAVITVTMRFHHGLGRSAVADDFIWATSAMWLSTTLGIEQNLTGLMAMLYALTLTISISVGGLYIAAKILDKPFDSTFKLLGYALAPLMIVGGLSHLFESFFLHYFDMAGNAFIHLFHLPFSELEPLATRKDQWLHIFKLFTYLSIAWSFILFVKRLKLIEAPFNRKVIAFPFASAMASTMLGLTFYVSYIFSTYGMAMRMHH